jgi:hypothetical protein
VITAAEVEFIRPLITQHLGYVRPVGEHLK